MKTDLLKANFLYRVWDGFPNILRLTLRCDHPVREPQLRAAVAEAAKRYPYLCIRLVREGEEYHFLPNEAPVPVLHGEGPAVFGTEEVNGHYQAVSFQEDCITFDISHNLCDFNGFIPWVKTVLYLYLVRTVDPHLSPDGIRLPGEPFLEHETEDPYEPLTIPEDLEPTETLPPAEPLFPDTRYAEGPGRRDFFIQADSPALIRVCKENGGSPITLTNWVLKELMRKLFPEQADLPVVITMPHSLREGLLGPNNYHDQLAPLMLRYEREADQLPFKEQLTLSRQTLRKRSEWNNMLCQIRSNVEFAEKITSLPTVEERRAFQMESTSQFLRYPETMCVTYPGRTDWGPLLAHLTELRVFASVLCAPLMVILSPMGDTFYFTFQQRDDTDIYARTFVSLLQELKIPARVTGNQVTKLPEVYIP